MSVFGVILVCIFHHLDWILRDMKYLSVFSPNVGIRTLFTQCYLFMYYLFGYACSKWCLIWEIYLLISFAWICCCCIYFGSSNCWSYLLKSMRITLVTKPWLQHCGLEPDLPICLLSSNHIIIYFSPGFCSKF